MHNPAAAPPRGRSMVRGPSTAPAPMQLVPMPPTQMAPSGHYAMQPQGVLPAPYAPMPQYAASRPRAHSAPTRPVAATGAAGETTNYNSYNSYTPLGKLYVIVRPMLTLYTCAPPLWKSYRLGIASPLLSMLPPNLWISLIY